MNNTMVRQSTYYLISVPVENLTSRFSFPLRPSFGPPQRVGELRINVQALSDSPISPLNFHSTACAMKAVKTGPNELQYEFRARNVELREDLSFDYAINVPQMKTKQKERRRKPALSIEFNERAVTQSL